MTTCSGRSGCESAVGSWSDPLRGAQGRAGADQFLTEEGVMTRLCSILSISLNCFAIVLLVLGVLSVSPSAWADDPTCVTDGDCEPGGLCVDGLCVAPC